MTELTTCSAFLGGILLLGIVIRFMIKKAVKEIKDSHAVKTQLLQEELHEVYLRAVDENRRESTNEKESDTDDGEEPRGEQP